MLREATVIRTEEGQIRRWFYDNDFDLIVWLMGDEEEVVDSFELCYEGWKGEAAIQWDLEQGFFEFKVDSGEANPARKQTPIFINGIQAEALDPAIFHQFQKVSDDIDPVIREFVLEKLQQLSPVS
jgi:hypothetical protein